MRFEVAPTYFQNQDVVNLARNLIGMGIETCVNHIRVSGIICETEAYEGTTDKACHAYGGKRTPRNEVMYAPGGVLYVYLCYGIHHLVNVVTHSEGEPHAILLRGMYVLQGMDEVLKRRKQVKATPQLAVGPGKLSQALGITTDWNGISVASPQFRLFHAYEKQMQPHIQSGPRIGVEYAQDHALWPYRFWVSWAQAAQLVPDLKQHEGYVV